MKILLVHNDYAKYSGEEAVVDKMDSLFHSLGHQVAQLRMSTANDRDNLKGKVKGFISGIHSPKGVTAMAEALDREKPDVVNVHNLYPYISPAALRECKKRSIPVIMTVHNYRLMCPTGLFLRDNKPCELCLQKSNEWSCIKYNCENSILKSVGYATRNAVARINRHYVDCVDFFACLTEFQRSKLIEAGFPPEKLLVIPNSIPLPLSLPSHYGEDPGEAPYIAFAGRLSPEKGIPLILEVARRHPEIPFKFAGALSPELMSQLSSLNTQNLPNVSFLGHLPGKELRDFYSNAAFFVMASTWYEGFPMTILETAVYAKPMVAPNHGAFPEIIESIGLLFKPNDINDLEKAILKLWNNPNLTAELGEKALKKVKSSYSSEIIKNLWNNLLENFNRIQ